MDNRSHRARKVTRGLLALIPAWAAAVLVPCCSASAEEKPALSRPEVRAAVVARRKAEAEARKAEAVAFARAAGLPVAGRIGNRVYELMAVRNGRLLYYVTHNVNAAISTAADRIRSTSPFNLDGAGLTVGVWDGGWIRETHQEFGGRATIMDTGGALNSHSTHVGGTIGAAGVDASAEGMAPSVNLDSYEWTSDYAEMTDRGATYAGEAGKIYVSNHSYGFLAGWEWGTWSGQARYHWVGAPWPVEETKKYDDFFGRYEDEAVQVDQVACDCPYYLIFNSAGNDRSDNPEEVPIKIAYWDVTHWAKADHDVAKHPQGDGLYKGGYDTLTAWAVAKNVMTVGSVTDAVSGDPASRDVSASAVNSFSCWGPTDDGRIKPDIVANGDNLYSSIATSDTAYDGTYSGTSMASPNAAGSAILLVEYYADLFSGDAVRASTLKALIIHTADDMGNPGPDYSYGWGLMNAEAAATLIKNYADLPAGTKIIEGALTAANPSDSYTVTWDGAYPIRATLSWTDPPGTATTEHDDTTAKLVNDLDLVVTGPPPGSTTFLPYVLARASPSDDATTGENNIDNVEQVHIASPPAAGDYTVTVDYDGTLTGGEQWYSLIITGGPKPPPTVSAVTPNTSERVVVAVEVTGDDFQPGAEVKLSKIGESDIEATGEQVAIGSIQCTLDLAGAAFGAWDVVVTNPDGQYDTLAAGFTVLTSIDITDVAPASGTVSKYGKVELLVTISNIVATELYDPDPAYDGLDLSATFTAPDGLTTWDVDGFYDGSEWRVRFAPDTEGDWTFEVTATDLSGTDVWTGGTFTCVSSANPGWVRIDGKYLRFCEGDVFFGVGHNNGWQYEVEEPTIADMTVGGENLLSFWMATPWETPYTIPARAPIENVDQGIGNYNQAACAYIDYLVGEAEAQGVYLLPTIWAHDQLCDTLSGWPQSWDNNAYSSLCLADDFYTTQVGGVDTEQWRYQRNFYRYLIARWGYSTAVAGWVLVAEIDGTDSYVSDPAEADTWLAAVRDLFVAGDRYRVNASDQYPVAVSKVDTVSADAETWDSGLGLHAVDSYESATDDVGVAATIAGQTIDMLDSGRPSFHSEFGGDTVEPSPPPVATQPTHLHNGIWAGLSAGAAMTPLVWCDGYDYPMLTDSGVGTAMRNHLKYLSEFASDISYLGDADIESASVTVDGGHPDFNAWGMKMPDRGFAWIQDTAGTMGGETLEISNVTPGQYIVLWYDVWTGGASYFDATYPSITVDGVGVLATTIPALAQSDIACRFMPAAEAPTAVVMDTMTARSVGLGAVVEWTTASEVENFGFEVLRRRGREDDLARTSRSESPQERPGGRWERVTARPVPGRLTAAGPRDYRYLDLTAPGHCEYRVETIATDGGRERHGARETMSVTVWLEDVGRSLDEVGELLRDRAASEYEGLQAQALAGLRLAQLAARPEGGRCRDAPKRDGGRLRLLASTSGLFQEAPAGQPRQSPSPGDVRLRTRGDGVFFVPAALLPAAPERSVLMTGGVPSPPLRADSSGLWFFAREYTDAYTDMNATFASAGRGPPGERRPGRPPADLFKRDALGVTVDTARAEENTHFFLGATGAPDPWFYSGFIRSGSSERRVEIDVPGFTGGPATLRIAVFGLTRDDGVDPDHELIVSLNDVTLADLTWDGRSYETFDLALTQGELRESSNTVGILVPETEAIPNGHGVALDYVEVAYPRRLSVASGPLLLQIRDSEEVEGGLLRRGYGARRGRAAKAGGLSAGSTTDRLEVGLAVEVGGLGAPELWVVKIGRTGRAEPVPAAFAGDGGGENGLPGGRTGGYVARFRLSPDDTAAGGGGVYYLATPAQVRSPVEVSGAVIASLPAGTDYVAVGPEEFRECAAPLLDTRHACGLRPAYLSLDSVIDTYGDGRYGAGGIARLVRELRPRYLLLVGDNSYDYLDREGGGVDPMVPAAVTSTWYLSRTNADALYGDLDGDGVPEVPVGRLPVRTREGLVRLIAKILDHDASFSELKGVLVADDADAGGDFPAAQDEVAERFPDVDWTKLYLGVHGDSAFVRRELTGAVDRGADLVIYQGHATSARLPSGAPVLDLGEAARWKGAPVVYLSTCWGAYIQKNTEAATSIAEVLLRSERGSPAVVGSTAPSSQASQAALLGDFLAEALCPVGSGTPPVPIPPKQPLRLRRPGARLSTGRPSTGGWPGGEGVGIGDALVRAQRSAAARAGSATSDGKRQDILDTVHCYTVLGDPAMPLVTGPPSDRTVGRADRRPPADHR